MIWKQHLCSQYFNLFDRWNFKYPNLASQPNLVALGFRAGYDTKAGVITPDDVGIYLTDALGGASLTSLLGLGAAAGTHEGVDAAAATPRVTVPTAVPARGPAPLQTPSNEAVAYSGGGWSVVAPDDLNGFEEEVQGPASDVVRPWKSSKSTQQKLQQQPQDLVQQQQQQQQEQEQQHSTIPKDIFSTVPATVADGKVNMTYFLQMLEQYDNFALDMILLQTKPDLTPHPAADHPDQILFSALVTGGVTAAKVRGYMRATHTVLEEQAKAAINKPFAVVKEAAAAMPAVMTENECVVAAAYYFPVTQYVTSHFGLLDTGVSMLEDVRISMGNMAGHGGEEDELHLHNEAEAEAGDPDAQLWLGRRYFWGYGGLQPNVQMARR